MAAVQFRYELDDHALIALWEDENNTKRAELENPFSMQSTPMGRPIVLKKPFQRAFHLSSRHRALDSRRSVESLPNRHNYICGPSAAVGERLAISLTF